MVKTRETYEFNKESVECIKKKLGYTVEDLKNFPEMFILVQNRNMSMTVIFNQRTQQYELTTITP